MSISNELNNASSSTLIKLENALDKLKEYDNTNEEINQKLGTALSLFKKYFSELEEPEFKPVYLKKGDVVSAEDYNKNLQSIYNDLSRFYEELQNFSTASIKAFNYSQVIIQQIRRKAEQLGSIVLDLRILNDFTRGDVIVAGDDFLNQDLINSSAGLGGERAEIIPGGAGLTLARVGTASVSNQPRVTVDVIPITPVQTPSVLVTAPTTTNRSPGFSTSLAGEFGNSFGTAPSVLEPEPGQPSTVATTVNTAPTPGNLQRFYEGNYYNFLGEARPEGGRFNLQTIVNIDAVTSNGGQQTGEYGSTEDGTFGQSIFLDYGATEQAKALARLKMLDNNPDTFWECEYVQKLSNPLVDDIQELIVSTNEDAQTTSGPTTASVDVDVESLNNLALSNDNVDLTIDIIISLPFEENINFVSINPLLFSNNAYVEVIDISTTNETQTDFETVPNWAELQFPKTITPEANEFLTDSQEGAALAPSKFAYGGQGVYPFPTTVANKIKLRLRVKDPVAQVYERTYILLKNIVDTKTTIDTTVTEGTFRF